MSNKSVFTQELQRGFKEKRIDKLSTEDKNNFRLKRIEQIFSELENKENRFIFYCPDIVIVNHIVKAIYDIAYTLHTLHYKVVILHEMKGFKCKWLLDDEHYSNYKDLNLEYVIERKNKKSKKEKNQYSFKPTDTLIVPDVFQDMFENIREVKLVQKVVLVTGYNGISNLEIGSDFRHLGVKSILYLNSKLKADYEALFPQITNNLLIDYNFINKKTFDKKIVDKSKVYPVIGISKIGNDKLAQQVCNLFYNKFHNLRVFSFKILDRTNYIEYVSSLQHCCLYLNLDETLGFYQSLLEAQELSVPTATFERRELEGDAVEKVVRLKRDAFEIVDFLGEYCKLWLTFPNHQITSELETLEIPDLNENEFQKSLSNVFTVLHEEKVKYFAIIKQAIEKNEINGETEAIA